MHHSSFYRLSFKWREEERFVDRVQSRLWVWTKTHTVFTWIIQYMVLKCDKIMGGRGQKYVDALLWVLNLSLKNHICCCNSLHSSLDILDHGCRDFLPANHKSCWVIKVWLLPVHVLWGWGQGSSASSTPNTISLLISLKAVILKQVRSFWKTVL